MQNENKPMPFTNSSFMKKYLEVFSNIAYTELTPTFSTKKPSISAHFAFKEHILLK